jgi:hypothetical protein
MLFKCFLNKVREKNNSREVFKSNFDYFLHVAHIESCKNIKLNGSPI